MATVTKVLGQARPGATTLTDLYTVPGATGTTVSSISVCNTAATATSFRVSIAPAGAVDATSQYLFYDVNISGNDTFVATVGLTLAATDVIRVYATLATLNFHAYGIEES
jgi:hypothetical protein